jgi:hypothetical protein
MKKSLIALVLLLLITSKCAHAEEKSVNVSFDSLTVHGLPPDPWTAQHLMTHKLDSGGRAIFNPGLNITYREKGWVFSGGLLEDCYGNPASLMLLGRDFKSGVKNLSFTLLGGLYVRKSPDGCNDTICWENHDFPLMIKTMAGSTKVDILPMVLAGVNYSVQIKKDVAWTTSLYSNFFLNHLITGLTFQLK